MRPVRNGPSRSAFCMSAQRRGCAARERRAAHTAACLVFKAVSGGDQGAYEYLGAHACACGRVAGGPAALALQPEYSGAYPEAAMSASS